jgi:NADPH:quinone reductase-like Zn-dependent oxidoreductase
MLAVKQQTAQEQPVAITPSRMAAAAIGGFGGPEVLELLEVPVPTLGDDDVLIRVYAAGVGPWDVKVRAGVMGTEYPLPLVLGSECAGVVEQVGANVSDFAPGDAVYAYALQGGTYAELVVAPAAVVAAKPHDATFAEAAALPVGATAAHQAILEDLAVRAGETVLVTGGAGGTGGFAVQIAAAAGAHVISTARPDSHEYVRSLGASEVYDYADDFVREILERHPEGVDALLECVGGENLARSLDAVRDGGRAATLVPPAPEAPVRGIAVQFVFARPDGERLAEVARLVDSGSLKVHLSQVFALADVASAHRSLESGTMRGKIVLQLRDEEAKMVAQTAEHPRATMIREGLTAVMQGDIAKLDAMFQDDVTWHVTGGSRHDFLNVTRHGKAEVYEWMGRSQGHGTLTLDLRDVLASDEYAAAIVHWTRERDGHPYEWLETMLFHFTPDGKISEYWGLPMDQQTVDASWD